MTKYMISQQRENELLCSLYFWESSEGGTQKDLKFKAEGNGMSLEFYTIVSVMTYNAKIKETLIFDGSVHPSSDTTDGALLEEDDNKGGVTTSPTVHAKINVSSNPTVSQPD